MVWTGDLETKEWDSEWSFPYHSICRGSMMNNLSTGLDIDSGLPCNINVYTMTQHHGLLNKRPRQEHHDVSDEQCLL